MAEPRPFRAVCSRGPGRRTVAAAPSAPKARHGCVRPTRRRGAACQRFRTAACAAALQAAASPAPADRVVFPPRRDLQGDAAAGAVSKDRWVPDPGRPYVQPDELAERLASSKVS